MKKYFLITIKTALFFAGLFIFLIGIARADSLKSRCADFDDAWFSGMSYGFGYCNPPNFRDVDITTAEASFGAHLEIGRVGEFEPSETPEDIDAKFNKDIYTEAGYGLVLGTSKNEERVSQTFYNVSLGSYATLSTYNFWEDVLDPNNNGKLLGQRQDVNIAYRIRQGICYATLSVRGKGPYSSKAYFGILSAKAKDEAGKVAEKMKSLELCKRAGLEPDPLKGTSIPTQPGELRQPTKSEVVEFTKNFAPEIPAVDEEGGSTPPPASSAGKDQTPDPYVVGMAPTVPTAEDIKFPPASGTEKKPYTATVKSIDGSGDMQLPDGSWVQLEVGSVIPEGAKVYSGYDSIVELRFSDHLVVYLRSLSELDMTIFRTNPTFYRTELKLESGELRFKVQESTIKTDMKVSTPHATAAVVGTDWAASYDKETGISSFEAYDNTVEVTSLKTGEKKTIASSYGSPIPRIEVGANGEMTEKKAIPKSEWAAFQASRQIFRERSVGLLTWVAMLVFILGGVCIWKRKWLVSHLRHE